MLWLTLIGIASLAFTNALECGQLIDETTKVEYDLRPLTKTSGDDWVTETKTSSYFINICHDILRSVNSSTGKESSHIGAYFWDKSSNVGWSIGSSEKTQLYVHDGELLMKMNEGDKVESTGKRRSTLIHFICDKNNKGLKYLEEVDSLFLFVWYTKAACATSGGISGWATFFIVFFTAIFMYFLVGILYNRNQGRRGLEQIPNLSFWKKLCMCFRKRGTVRLPAYNRLDAEDGRITLVDDEDG